MKPKISSDDRPCLSVVIPCYNEAAAIPSMADEVAQFVDSEAARRAFSRIEILVVDDGSTDKSLDLLERSTHWRLLKSPMNLGYGGALRLGFGQAQGELLAFLDMDRTYSIFDLVPMANQLRHSNADVVFGSRPRQPTDQMPFIRKIGNSFFATLTRALTPTALSDVCTGLRLMKAQSVRSLLFETQQNGLDYSMALTVAMLRSHLNCIELPVQYRERLGESKLTVVGDGFRFLWALTRGAYGRKSNHSRNLNLK